MKNKKESNVCVYCHFGIFKTTMKEHLKTCESKHYYDKLSNNYKSKINSRYGKTPIKVYEINDMFKKLDKNKPKINYNKVLGIFNYCLYSIILFTIPFIVINSYIEKIINPIWTIIIIIVWNICLKIFVDIVNDLKNEM